MARKAEEWTMTMKDIMSNFPTREDIAEIMSKMRDLTGTLPSKDELARAVGLQPRSDDMLLPLTMFGAGILVGAAVALLFAPKAGRELREDLNDRARELREQYIGAQRSTAESVAAAASDLYPPGA